MSDNSQSVENTPYISVIAPFYNEEDNIPLVYENLTNTFSETSHSYELVFVNDGSSDASLERLQTLAASDNRVKVISLIRNFGQTAAMQAGFDKAEGEVIIAIDGDGQNDPADIPRLLEKLDEGYDVVSGWRKDRKDKAITRRLPSQVANKLISKLSGVALNDYGCSLKAYRRDSIKGVRLYGEMHRFIPIYAAWQGGKVTELEVNHHPRIHGESKYGLNRIFKVILDLLLVMFFDRFLTKPIHAFGGASLICFVGAMISGFWALWLKFADGVPFINTPLPLLVVMLLITSLMSLLMGIVAELVIRTYYESQDKTIYIIGEELNTRDAK